MTDSTASETRSQVVSLARNHLVSFLRNQVVSLARNQVVNITGISTGQHNRHRYPGYFLPMYSK